MPFAPENDLSKRTLSEILNAASARHLVAFPDRLPNLYITTLTEDIFVSPNIATHLSNNVAEIKEIFALREKDMNNFSAMVDTEEVAGLEINWMTLNDLDTYGGCISKKFPQTMNALALYHHEVGHFVVPSGSFKTQKPTNENPFPRRPSFQTRHLAECAADAYMALCHLQCFGGETDIGDIAPAGRASNLILHDAFIHYTSAVIQKVILLKDDPTIDIYNLSYTETAALAEKIAHEYSYDNMTLSMISSVFSRAKWLYQMALDDDGKEVDVPWDKIIHAVVKTMQECDQDSDHEIYRAGKSFLRSPKMQERIEEIAKTDPSFRDIFAFMESFEKENGIILNSALAMDAARKKAPNTTPILEL